MKDLASKLHPSNAIPPAAARTDNTAITTTILDLQGCNSAMLVLLPGANTDANATFGVELTESDDSGMSGATAVADKDLIGTEALAGFTFGDDNEARKLGYIGSKRYIQATVTPVGNDSGNIFLSACWLKGDLAVSPAPNPPQ